MKASTEEAITTAYRRVHALGRQGIETVEKLAAYGDAQLDLLYRRVEPVARAGWSPDPEHRLSDKERATLLHDALGGIASLRPTLSLLAGHAGPADTVHLLVLTDGYDAYSVEGVFSTYDLAMAARVPDRESQVDYYDVVPFVLNQPREDQ